MPNFGFSLITRRVRDADLVGLDLSSLRMLINGAEMAREDSMASFMERLTPSGLRSDVMYSGYGMAEVVLTISVGPLRIDWINAAELRQSGRATAMTERAPGAMPLVSSGPTIEGVELAICDAEGNFLPDRQLGEVMVRSPGRFNGYWQRPDLSQAALFGDWLHSGDLGYLADGELYLCGRQKDLIIVGGSNIHPEDVEAIAERVEGVQPGRAVAFGVADSQLGTERIVLLCELREPPPENLRDIDRTLRRAVLRELDVTLGDLRFVPRGWIVKTTSGKHARTANREKYLSEKVPSSS
jgi:acyl-CoA synthetase (AMP-forming)/AMP-acid ligase II